jgi:hypothetical protein
VQGPLRILEFTPDEKSRPESGKQGWEPPRKVCAPPRGWRRDQDGALWLTKWKPPPLTAARKAEVEAHRLADEEDDMTNRLISSSAIHGPGKTLRKGTPKPDQNPFTPGHNITPIGAVATDVETSGMTVSAAIKILRHDPDYLGDIPTERLHDLLTITIDAAVKKCHPRIRREIKMRSNA